MKVVLIAPPVMDFAAGRHGGRPIPIAMDAYRHCPPYGIYLLASVLKDHGHEVVIADLVADGTGSIDKYSCDFDEAQLIGISATSMSWPSAKDIISQIYELYPHVPIVLGGVHPTLFDKYLMAYFPVQFIIRWEAEQTLPLLCDAIIGKISLTDVPNLTWRTYNNSVIRNRELQESNLSNSDIGKLPVPDYIELPKGLYRCLAVESSRGCAFDCSFCSSMYRKRKNLRSISPEKFVHRLVQIESQLNRVIDGAIHVIDDDFTFNADRIKAIVRIIHQNGISERLKNRLVYNATLTSLLAPGVIEALAPFTKQLLVGAECGYEKGLNSIGKKTTCKMIEDTADLLKKFGISSRADFSFVIGLPVISKKKEGDKPGVQKDQEDIQFEEKKDVIETIKFAVDLHAKYEVRILLQWYYQIPGSNIWKYQKKQKEQWIHESMYDNYGFFRDLHLFRSAVKLTPDEVYEVSAIVHQLQTISQLRKPGFQGIEYEVPEAISTYYPLPKGEGLFSVQELDEAKGTENVSSKQKPK